MDVSKSIGIIQFILICLLLISLNGFGQNVEFKNDTLSYRFHKYYVGKELQLGHGSSKNQLFSFISNVCRRISGRGFDEYAGFAA